MLKYQVVILKTLLVGRYMYSVYSIVQAIAFIIVDVGSTTNYVPWICGFNYGIFERVSRI